MRDFQVKDRDVEEVKVEFLLAGKRALITGASRGIGARVAQMLAERGADVAVNYRSKSVRAFEVAESIKALKRSVLLLQADITSDEEVKAMYQAYRDSWIQLDILVLNASGGLEKDKQNDYAMLLNRDAQIRLVDGAIPMMPRGGIIIFVTSHLAHFYGRKPVYEGYEAVAMSKRAGEDKLRGMIPELMERGITLVVVSGDLIDGTITPKLLQRHSPGIIERRRQEAGSIPNVDDFARAIVSSAVTELEQSGRTVYVGNVD